MILSIGFLVVIKSSNIVEENNYPNKRFSIDRFDEVEEDIVYLMIYLIYLMI